MRAFSLSASVTGMMLLLASACSDGDDGTSSFPDHAVSYPDSEVIETTEEDGQVRTTFRTDATLDEVADFFRSEYDTEPWGVTRVDGDRRLGSWVIFFRDRERDILGTARVVDTSDSNDVEYTLEFTFLDRVPTSPTDIVSEDD